MVRLGVRSRCAAAVLVVVAAACSARSRVQQRPGTNGDAGRASVGGSSAGRESDAGEGGGGATSAAGHGGVTGGTSGASAGASSQSGVSGTAGTGGTGAGGAPEVGGASATGGASEAGTGGDGDGPAWIPTGVFGPEVDDFLDATSDYVEAMCREGLCLEQNEEELLQDCVEAELYNFAPSVEWVACASRTGAEFEQVMTELAAERRACVAMVETGSCDIPLCPPSSVDWSFDGCPAWRPYSTACPTGEATFGLCNGRSDCPDGYDERNCKRDAPAYICTDRMTVGWHTICDGTDDCSDGIDEFRCEPDIAASNLD